MHVKVSKVLIKMQISQEEMNDYRENWLQCLSTKVYFQLPITLTTKAEACHTCSLLQADFLFRNSAKRVPMLPRMRLKENRLLILFIKEVLLVPF